MRVQKDKNGITVKGYAGTTGVLLAFNVSSERRKGLLGFSVERLKPGAKKWEWKQSMLTFPGENHEPGASVPTDIAPIQKFRWSDYAVWPESKYSYRIHAAYWHKNEPKKLNLVEGPTIEVNTASADEDGKHNIVFNRAAATSQAFTRDYPKAIELIEAKRKDGGLPKLTVDELEKVSPGVKDWLSRGALKQILAIIEAAKDSNWALDIAIYEYEWHEIVKAVNDAASRGVAVRLIYHAKKGDKQTDENKKSAKGLKNIQGRITNAIFHNKFIILSRVKKIAEKAQRIPVTVLCGSTNFTENGLFRQANVVHVVRTPKGEDHNPTAESYAKTFEEIWRDPTDPAKTKKWIDKNNLLDPTSEIFAGFSPRSGQKDLDAFALTIKAAKNDVLFCTAFVLPKKIVNALLGEPKDPILRLGVQNMDSNKIAGFHRDRTAQFVATALLDHGVEGWVKTFLKERRTGGHGNILIHTKAVVIDFTSERPIVISGSHNLSGNASGSNDENYLMVRGNVDIADSYGIELMRIYDHYRFRWVATQSAMGKKTISLTMDDSWTNRYFKKDSLHYRDRLRFVGK